MRSFGLALLVALVPNVALAQATLITGLGGPLDFGDRSPPRSDDDPAPAAIDLGATFPAGIDLYGQHVADVFVNVNGILTFGAPIAAFDPAPFPRTAGSVPMIAGWWANVDTRPVPPSETNGNQIYYASSAEHFVVTWVDVGYFDQHVDLVDTFQIVLSPTASGIAGAVDVEWRYRRCEWTTGDDAASGGSGGLGGQAAQAGFDVGDGIHSAPLPGSGTAAILSLCTQGSGADMGTFRMTIGGPARCGNAFVEAGEACDDGNDAPHDFCDRCTVVTPCFTTLDDGGGEDPFDAGSDDASMDASIGPCPEPDAGTTDDAALSAPDASHHDGGHRGDGGVRFDAGPRIDSGVRRDGSVAPPTHSLDLTGGGCGCRVRARSTTGGGWMLIVAAMIAALGSRRSAVRVARGARARR